MADADTGLPGAVIRESRELYVENGELRHGLHVTLAPDQFNMLREGYLCPPPPHGCLARQREAFPEKCIEPYCNFNLRRDLPRWLERAFAGYETLWPDREPADLERERWMAERGIWLPESE